MNFVFNTIYENITKSLIPSSSHNNGSFFKINLAIFNHKIYKPPLIYFNICR